MIYGVTQQIYGVTEQIYGVTEQIYGVTEQIYGVTQQIYGVTQQIYGVTEQIYGVTEQIYGVTEQIYGVTEQIYGVTEQIYGVTEQIYGEGLKAISCCPINRGGAKCRIMLSPRPSPLPSRYFDIVLISSIQWTACDGDKFEYTATSFRGVGGRAYGYSLRSLGNFTQRAHRESSPRAPISTSRAPREHAETTPKAPREYLMSTSRAPQEHAESTPIARRKHLGSTPRVPREHAESTSRATLKTPITMKVVRATDRQKCFRTTAIFAEITRSFFLRVSHMISSLRNREL
ncbi:predicted protein [Nematostella vectensis]|uniref:Uncharacterized protein n=1 Tax=Nematostella vectensis TaxID=45351 RepID=A7SQD0_NEMVE|nr:predicted protein [Nematostella vectensis]|eukprot:XP_001626210.1 predicted protein [Nematostella vectensis]